MSARLCIRFHNLVLFGTLVVNGCGSGSSQDFTTCGNGRLDAGERCDDGNSDDHDACTTVCQPARCGDGVAYTGVEDCDSRDLNGGTCSPLGLAGNPGCDAACRYDYSTCGAVFTLTPTPAPPTATPTATPTPPGSACGDGLLSPNESCSTCAPDCTPQPCTDDDQSAEITVALALPGGQQATRIEVGLAYRTNVVTLPSTSGNRVRSLSSPPIPLRATDTDYRVDVVAQSPAITSGPFFNVRFDRCAGAAEPTSADFACVVTLCRSGTNDLSGCTCSAAP